MPAAGKDASLFKSFLEEIEKTLDIKKTIEVLGIGEGEAKVFLRSVLSRLFPQTERLIIYVDGASRGNPGKAGAGAVIKGADGRVVKEIRKSLGVATNNVAEYMALITALTDARDMGGKSVHVFADSELIVKQINGEYRVKSEGLKTLYQKVIAIKGDFSEFRITHIPREKNKEADTLANAAIDGV
ncbi:MAG: ribonuclease HI family protein [Deltaproteobacteria bacterium]|nr:ribonuclease HI family protein [Deltaproteobacteria bacterium]